MIRKGIFWQLLPSFLLITLGALLALFWITFRTYKESFLRQISNDLQINAILIRDEFFPLLEGKDWERLSEKCVHLGRQTGVRITVILDSGVVVGDSHEAPSNMENHGDRPEVRDSLTGGIGESLRFSTTLDQTMMYVAVPVMAEDRATAVIRTSLPITLIEEVQQQFGRKVILAGILIACAAAAGSYMISRLISAPLEKLRQGADGFARGDLDNQLEIPASTEMASLAQAMNQMARQLSERIKTVSGQRQELQALLSSMAEGVVAVDKDLSVLNVNSEALRIFDIDPDRIRGKPLEKVISNDHLNGVVNACLHSQENVVREFETENEPIRLLIAHGSPLLNTDGGIFGVVVVLADVTRLRRLEQIRREFVANVSHELKTPMTSIKGYVETLRDGAYKNEEDAVKFLETVKRQSDRLVSILEDLLTLSRVEEGVGEFAFSEGPILRVLDSAIESCSLKADQKNIRIETDYAADIRLSMNAALLEQAVINLVDNAIKFSYEGSSVKVSLSQNNGNVEIGVEDHGMGIPEDSIPRLFERFYRIDKARSRKLGGTGLGLAIVKYIAKMHRGTVTVTSEPKKGSRFSVSIPLDVN